MACPETGIPRSALRFRSAAGSRLSAADYPDLPEVLFQTPQAGQVGRELLERDHAVITDYGLLRRKDGGQLPVFQPEQQENEITGPAFAGM